jgi:hypothetical protein
VYAPTECVSVGCWQAEKGSVYCDHQLQSHGVGHAQVLFQLIWSNPIYLSRAGCSGFCAFCVYERRPHGASGSGFLPTLLRKLQGSGSGFLPTHPTLNKEVYLSRAGCLGFCAFLRVRAHTTRCVRVRVSPNTPTKIAGVRVRVSPNTSYSRSRSLSLPRWMLGFLCVFACTSADHTVRLVHVFSQHSYENCRVHHA